MFGAPGLGVVALTVWSVDKADKAGVGSVRLWFVAWACIAWLGLCGLRECGSCGLRTPGSESQWSVVVRSRCIGQ